MQNPSPPGRGCPEGAGEGPLTDGATSSPQNWLFEGSYPHPALRAKEKAAFRPFSRREKGKASTESDPLAMTATTAHADPASADKARWDGVDLPAVARRVGTPCHVYSASAIRERIDALLRDVDQLAGGDDPASGWSALAPDPASGDSTALPEQRS